MLEIDALRCRYGRPALAFEPASKRRLGSDPPTSWFGRVTHQPSGENWPYWEGTPLRPLLQLVLDDLPYLPGRLRDIAFLTMFVHPEHYPDGASNGTTWALRSASRQEDLVPIATPEMDWSVKHQPLDFARLVEDYPCFEDLSEELPGSLWDEFAGQFPTRDGIKLGGWPRLIQSSLCWAPHNQHPARPEYVLQVDSMVELNWSWGDVGCAYIGRGTVGPQKNEFFIDWQCY